MTTKQVLDWSNYSGVPTDAQVANLIADGWDSVILGTQNPVITRQQYSALARNNLPVEALYVFVYWTNADYGLLDAAMKLAREWGLKVWLDCEWNLTGYPGTGTHAPSPPAILSMIHAYKTYLAETYQGIYTGRWWWPTYTADSHDFADDPLWHANYGPMPDTVFAGFLPYGGWTRPVIWQYNSEGADGVTADLNEELIYEPMVVTREWGWGNEMGGWETRGKQLVIWNQHVEIEAYGDVEGAFPGQRWHNAGGMWLKEAA